MFTTSRSKRIRAGTQIAFLLSAAGAGAQARTGELLLHVTDPSGRNVAATVDVRSAANGYQKRSTLSVDGILDLNTMPFGIYQVKIDEPGFAPGRLLVRILAAVPEKVDFRLQIAPLATRVDVGGDATLVDPDRTSSVEQIGAREIERRVGSLPGRSVQDLVNTQPGWLYEGNAVLHPRGSEYQTQFVLDGIPFTDNRSPGFGPEIEADDLQSIAIYTAGIPAEYGRKLGGVIELNTREDTQPGLHGRVVLAGGSYDTASSFGELHYQRGRSTLGAAASGSTTAHYLNPVVTENYTNTAKTGDFSGNLVEDFTARDRLHLDLRHEFSRFLVPNELVQQQAGQRQHGDNSETSGMADFRHTFSANTLATFAGMVRDHSSGLDSNPQSTPILATQSNHFREGYFKTAVSLHRGRHEIKAGLETDNTFLNERFAYSITDPTQFDDDTPPALSFSASRPQLEQAAFVEDTIRPGAWTIAVGLRWDHYQLLLNQKAFSPRVSLARSLPRLGTVLHASYDRVFQTPSFENILISSSPQIDALSPQFLRLPVQPSRGNYFEGGVTQALASRMRLDVNVYRRNVRNFADDDQLLNTGVSYPISFERAVVYGAEAKFEVVHLARLTGFVSYSYMVGTAWNPVTGGLFLGDDASAAISQTGGRFPISQDQRNTVRTRFGYQLTRRLWIASGASYGSGLPFQFTGEQADALAQYGPAVVSRVNFERGRVRPQLAVSASAGLEIHSTDRMKMRLQADGDNLNNRLNVIDFGGLFSGNAIGPEHSYSLRLMTSF